MRTERADYDVADAACGSESQTRLDDHFRRYSGWLGKVLRKRFGRSGIDVDDVVQEAYVRLLRYVSGRRDERPRALLIAIASNVARDAMRRSKRQAPLAEAGPEAHLETDQFEQLLLKETVLGLPKPFRDVFLLARYTAMTHEDIARHFGISVKTVEWRMSRAVALCAQALEIER